MFIRNLKKCKKFMAGDNTILRELFNPLKDDLNLRYSLAHAVLKPKKISYNHKLKTSEVYYILQGRGLMHIGNEKEEVIEGDAVYIPPNTSQRIKNIGKKDLIFICIVDPAWRPEDEEVLDN
jgi:mannose-6-phosphate isomerase-like protein (cupin superfamily)